MIADGEWVVSNLSEFEGKKLASVSKGELDLGEITEDEKRRPRQRCRRISRPYCKNKRKA